MVDLHHVGVPLGLPHLKPGVVPGLHELNAVVSHQATLDRGAAALEHDVVAVHLHQLAAALLNPRLLPVSRCLELCRRFTALIVCDLVARHLRVCVHGPHAVILHRCVGVFLRGHRLVAVLQSAKAARHVVDQVVTLAVDPIEVGQVGIGPHDGHALNSPIRHANINRVRRIILDFPLFDALGREVEGWNWSVHAVHAVLAVLRVKLVPVSDVGVVFDDFVDRALLALEVLAHHAVLDSNAGAGLDFLRNVLGQTVRQKPGNVRVDDLFKHGAHKVPSLHGGHDLEAKQLRKLETGQQRFAFSVGRQVQRLVGLPDFSVVHARNNNRPHGPAVGRHAGLTVDVGHKAPHDDGVERLAIF